MWSHREEGPGIIATVLWLLIAKSVKVSIEQKKRRDSNYNEQEKVCWDYLLSEAQALRFLALDSKVSNGIDRAEEEERQ